MDINKVADVKELKALAFDQIAILEQAQANIQALNGRIAELQAQEQEEVKAEKK